MEELLRPVTEETMSQLLLVSSSATGTSDCRAGETSPARAAGLDKQNAKILC